MYLFVFVLNTLDHLQLTEISVNITTENVQLVSTKCCRHTESILIFSLGEVDTSANGV